MIRPGEPTRLQAAMVAARDVIADAQEQLDERAYVEFVQFLVDLVAREAASCSAWERRQ